MGYSPWGRKEFDTTERTHKCGMQRRKILSSNSLKNEDKTLNRDRLICKEKEGVEVNVLFLNQYNVIKFSLL